MLLAVFAVGECVASGGCTRDDTDAVVRDRTVPLLGPLYQAAPLLMERASAGEFCPLEPDTASFAAPTEALILLYKPLRPPCTTSEAKLFASPLLPGRGEA